MANEGSSSSDESLDVMNIKFNPMRALYSSKLVIPSQTAPVYDNLSKYESVIKGSAAGPSKTEEPDIDDSSKRQFLPHQLPVTGKNQDRWMAANAKNVLMKMKSTLGPLSMMFECMETKARVKALVIVVEKTTDCNTSALSLHYRDIINTTFTLVSLMCCNFNAFIVFIVVSLGLPDEVKFEVRDEDVPKIVVKESSRNTETLERHVPQMLLRGEQIALIMKIN